MPLIARPIGGGMKLGLAVIALTAIGSVRNAGAGGNWPQWGGPKRDNVSTETGLLKDWPGGGPALAWKVTGIGAGYSSVSVAGGRIVTMGDQGDGAYVVSLDEKDGAKQWSTRIGQPGGGGGYAGPRCSPTLDGDFVYALGQHGDLVCLEAASGKEVWHKKMEKDFGGQMMSGWGYSESPLVEGEKLVCTPGGAKGTVIALNKKTGDTLWRSAEITDSAAYSSIVPAEILGRHQYVQLTAEHVFGLAPDTGKVLWSGQRKGGTAVIPTPIVHDNEVFVTSGYNAGCNLFKITGSNDEFKAEQVYHNNNMKNHHGGVVFMDGHVYGLSDPGLLVCLNWADGKDVWKDRTPGKGSLTSAEGMLYCRNESGPGTVYLIEATAAGYKEHGRFDQPGRSNANSWPHPVIADGKLYLRDQDLLLCYDVKAK